MGRSEKKRNKEKSKKSETKSFSEILLALYVKFRQFFQPYYRYYPKSDNHSKKPSKNTKKSVSKNASRSKVGSKKSVTKKSSSNKQRARIFNYPKPLDNCMSFKKKPSIGSIWYYHDSKRHQLFGHFGPGQGYQFKTRSNKERAKLKPLVFPRQGKAFDRTHTIPIGYHGSENDPRLLIGWDSTANRKLFNDFEQKMKALKFPIYWVTLVDRSKDGARWRYMVYDARTGNLVDSIEHRMKCPFVWKG